MKQHLKNAGNRSIKKICLKQLTGILNLDSLVKKIRQPTKKNDLQEEIKDEDKDKKTPGIFNLDSLVKKIHLPTECNDFQEENEDKDEDKKTTKLPEQDMVIYDIVQTNGLKFSVKYSKINYIIVEEEWVDGEMNTLSNIRSH